MGHTCLVTQAVVLEIKMKKDDNDMLLKPNLPLLPISCVASSIGVHPRTLRIYDKCGILSPKRTNKDRRVYSLNDVERAKAILYLTRNLAMNIAGVKMIISALEVAKVKPKDYIKYIEKVAKNAKFDIEIQKSNIEKTAKRGRKPASK